MAHYEVHYLDVKDADSIIIRYEDGNNKYIVLIDAGNVGDSDKIKRYIWSHWATHTIDLAVCTHPDSDHKGGFFDLLKDSEMTFKEFWINTPDDVISEDSYNRVYPKGNWLSHCRECYSHPTDRNCQNLVTLAINKCTQSACPAYNGKTHPHIPITVVGPTTDFYRPLAWTILENNKRAKDTDNSLYEDYGYFSAIEAKSSIDNESDDDSPTNAGSIMLLFEPQGYGRFFLMGDANRAAISDALNNHPNLSGANIKVPHHGSKHNMTSTLIDVLAPNCAIISAKGTRKHPSRGIVHCLSKHCNVYSTHISGDLYHSPETSQNPATPLKNKQ